MKFARWHCPEVEHGTRFHDVARPLAARCGCQICHPSVFGDTGEAIQPYCLHILALHNAFVFKYNKCVSKTDTNPPFAFQIAFPRGTDFAGFLQGGSKSRDLQSEISVPIESRIESADSRLQL